jgi:HlyD family secretion protein
LISPALDPGSTTVEVWVRVENKSGELKPGTAARVAIAAETVHDTVVVPASAVLKDEAGKPYVMVVQNSTAKKREVETGIKDGDDVQLVSGVKPGEVVITTGAYGLDDGTKVKVVAGEKDDKSDSEKPPAGKGQKDDKKTSDEKSGGKD